MKFPEINNIIPICVALDIAIIGIAYPIIIDKISNIGSKYSSDYLSELFEKEFPQSKFGIKIFGKNISYFILAIYLTVLSFLPLIFKFEPLYDWGKYWIINNSADLLVFLTSTALIIFFFIWLDKVSIYNHKSTKLLNYLISKYNNSKENEENYHLKTINEFTYYAIRNQDIHIQKTLVSFYFDEFSKLQKNHDNETPLIYPIDLYQLNYNVTSELVDSHKNKLRVLEHRAVSGIWILGEGFSAISTSKESYTWLWRNINLIVEKTDFLKMYWERAHQHYDHKLRHIQGEEYNLETNQYSNQQSIDKRIEERKEFLEFNYAFGGLLMFKQNFNAIKFVFNHSTSLPPNYVLLPTHMTEIFEMLQNFSDDNNLSENNIEFKYHFSGLDDYWGQKIRFWINSYLALLFIRQFSLRPFMTFHDFKGLPNLPTKTYELNYWLRNILIFENDIKKVKSNTQLMDALGYNDIIVEDSTNNTFSKFLDELKTKIEEKIEYNENNITLHPPKVKQFTEKTDEILENAFNKYKVIQNPNDISNQDDVSKFGVNGLQTEYPKQAFTEDDSHIDYDTFFANQVVRNRLDYYIPNSFLTARTKRYLFKESELNSAIKKLKIDSNYVIVAINPSYGKLDLIKEFKDLVINLRSTNNAIQDTFFVLKKSDLPTIKNLEFEDSETEADSLTTRKNNVYTSVLDLNLEENKEIREKWLDRGTESDLRKQVQITIAFKTIIIWQNQRNVIQLNIYSQFREQGIVSELTDVKALE
ncbi:hypothetical protein [Lacinutrix mariniflava]|uniref:hypothetical protein n=1 Tax=Lacinutrix mariniflava TaxID=342955 RepID=UPI0006E26416|nr:hypothetical protein [Lacinutrix mariniflava]